MKSKLLLKASLFLFVFIAVLSVLVYVVNFRDIDKTAVDQIKSENADMVSDAIGAEIKEVKKTSSQDHVLGNVTAKVKIISYSDFTCVFCGDHSADLAALKQEFGNDIAIYFRHYLLDVNGEAFASANASECASEQDKFWEMHDKLFLLNTSGLLNADSYLSAAQELGLDMEKFKSCQESLKYSDKIESDIKSAVDSGVVGSPTTYVNSEMISGARPLDDYIDRDGNNVEGLRTIVKKNLK